MDQYCKSFKLPTGDELGKIELVWTTIKDVFEILVEVAIVRAVDFKLDVENFLNRFKDVCFVLWTSRPLAK